MKSDPKISLLGGSPNEANPLVSIEAIAGNEVLEKGK
jgi:hypothetical protein